MRDFLKVFPDEAAFEAVDQATALFIPENSLNIFTLMEWVESYVRPQ